MWCPCVCVGVCVHRFWARFRVGAATDRGYLHTSFMAPPARCITHKRADAKSASAESAQHNRFRLDFQQCSARSHARLAQSLEVIAKVCCFFSSLALAFVRVRCYFVSVAPEVRRPPPHNWFSEEIKIML